MNEPELCGKIQSLFVASDKFRSRSEARQVYMGRRRGNGDLVVNRCTTILLTSTLVSQFVYTMPATRSKKGKKSKAAAAPPVSVPALEPVPAPAPEPEPELEVEHRTVDDSAMSTDQPESSDSTSLVETTANIVASAEATVVNSAEVVVEMVEDVVGAASEFVEEMTMGGIEENSGRTNESGSTPVESEKEAASKLTLEERKAKLDELRKKMVCLLHLPNL